MQGWGLPLSDGLGDAAFTNHRRISVGHHELLCGAHGESTAGLGGFRATGCALGDLTQAERCPTVSWLHHLGHMGKALQEIKWRITH